MSTHANIIIKTGTGYKSVYLNYDGYPSAALKVLHDHYTAPERAAELIERGNISILARNMTRPLNHSFDNPTPDYCVFYGRDYEEQNQEPTGSADLHDHIDQEYSYLYQNGAWHLAANFGKLTYEPLLLSELE